MRERREILGDAMRTAGMTQSELARLSGVRQPSISQMLSGRIPVGEEMLRRLLACMGMRLEVNYRLIRPELTRSAKRSWLLHRRLSRLLDPETLERWAARIALNLEQASGRVRGEPHRRNLERWRRLVDGKDLIGLHAVLTGLDEDAIQMREVSPMRGLLSPAERAEVLGLATEARPTRGGRRGPRRSAPASENRP